MSNCTKISYIPDLSTSAMHMLYDLKLLILRDVGLTVEVRHSYAKAVSGFRGELMKFFEAQPALT